ncbi:hypothetical protein QAD02_011582 [Eretmocerus hayati]|uniref:Uncharacterized protein n=1 Tax=Eretmocerus hayati TaxID=131215 RepID=A0ACC2NYB4_9HYME|nr:hypothetical protein QAD02_011582 [Eretmocerus hayati]
MQKRPPGEEIVISGIAGRYPESDNVNEFLDNLLNKVDMITEDDRRWNLEHPEIPKGTGKISNLEKFDALFFGVHAKQAHCMDPMGRMLLEHSYEAFIDAGLNPRRLQGQNIGVFIGVCESETEVSMMSDKNTDIEYGIIGTSKAMLANRISYTFGITGPSFAVDTACSSSLFAMENAYRAIYDGQCDGAIVAGTNLCLQPHTSKHFWRLGVLSPESRSKVFDESSDGYARSEAISVILLQKAKDAKRIYATVANAKTNSDGFKEYGITFPSSEMQCKLMRECYEESGILPSEVAYVEAHGTGTRVGDLVEITSLDEVFGKDSKRKSPVPIASVKSNLGHGEPSSGIVAVTKVLLAMECGVLPPHLHLKNLRKELTPISEGRLKVITEPTPWQGGVACVNSFGFGGVNVHVILKSNEKEKINKGLPSDNLPRLVGVSGRTEEAVDTLLTDLEKKPVDAEYVGLLHDIHSEDIKGHLFRGYTLLEPGTETQDPIREIMPSDGTKRPVWFIFAGMGSQWPGMGEALLRLPVFAEAIRQCDEILKPLKVDIYNILTSKDDTCYTILNSFVGITAVQIGLVDLLSSLGIKPDNMMGHSLGECGCAYADGSTTLKQTLLNGYYRGLVSAETELVKGTMAAVGLGFNDLKDKMPEDIVIACHNSSTSSTISGPAESVKNFAEKLKAENIFVKEVQSGNLAYHSPYISPVGPRYLALMKELIPNPKTRSEKWLSTSVPKEKWNTPAGQLASAEYFLNNLLHPVLFEEVSAMIPEDAITIEIAPHGLLQAILRKSLAPGVAKIPLTLRNHKDNLKYFLQAIGKLYNIGVQPQLSNLYPEIKYPVSRGTRSISPYIKWEHSDDWFVSTYENEKDNSGGRFFKISLADSKYTSLSGHVIDGRNIFPASGYLKLVWETFATMLEKDYLDVPVIFKEIQFKRATNIPETGELLFKVTIQPGSGRFEVSEGGATVVSGIIYTSSHPEKERLGVSPPETDEEEVLTTRDIYKKFKLSGYNYQGLYRSLKRSTISGLKGHIAWHDDWISFLDNVFQMILFRISVRGIYLPTSLDKLIIDPKVHLDAMETVDEEKEYPVRLHELHNVMMSGGVEIWGLGGSSISRRKNPDEPILEEYRFIPFEDTTSLSIHETACLVFQLALENSLGRVVDSIELVKDIEIPAENLMSPYFSKISNGTPFTQANINLLSVNKIYEDEPLLKNITITNPEQIKSPMEASIAIGYGLSKKDRNDDLLLLVTELKSGGFLVNREVENVGNNTVALKHDDLDFILKKKCGDETVTLFRKRVKEIPEKPFIINISYENFDWLKEMQKIMTEVTKDANVNKYRIYFISQGDYDTGLVGFINCLTQEPGGEIVRAVYIQDKKAEKFSLENPFYAKQLSKDMRINVLGTNGVWGTYRHLPLSPAETREVHHIVADQGTRGDLSSLTWFEGPLSKGFKHKDLVHIIYSSLNFRDVMLATNKLSIQTSGMGEKGPEWSIGLEFCGYNTAGKRVMGVSNDSTLTNLLVVDPALTVPIPDNWTFEEAATVPVAYLTCYYALYIKGNMRKGDKVLIHSGTGGVGQAAIYLALHEGCEIFTTVGTPEKRQFIRDNFPQIKEDHIGNSRDTSFKRMVMEQTNGKGVDIVLNSLAEEKLQASIECLAIGGRFLEIGKFDMASNNPLGMRIFLREVSFHSVMLDNIFHQSTEKKSGLMKYLLEGLRNGAVKPLGRKIFPRDQIEAAFRYMAAGKHMGKIVLKVREETEPLDSLITALPKYYCLKEKSYIVLGGLGGFGLELADWLIKRGARNLVIVSRSGIKNAYQKMKIDMWNKCGSRVVIVSGKDAAIRGDCEAIISAAIQLGPVDGIFNAAVVYKDALWDNQTPEMYDVSLRCKAWATKAFDVVSRKMCPSLRHFVVFSSLACGRGNAGQTNYGLANSTMERICERRVAEGLPGLAIQWGPIGDVGALDQDGEELTWSGLLNQRINSCMEELEKFMLQRRPVVSCMIVTEKETKNTDSGNMVEAILNIMGFKDLTGVSLGTPLSELGMDSMMAVEIKQTLERQFGVFLNVQDLRNLNFKRIQEISENSGASEKKGEASSDGLSEQERVSENIRLREVFLGIDVNHDKHLKLNTVSESGKKEIFLIPGLDGFGTVYRDLVPKLRVPATCLQLGNDTTYDRITDMADSFLPYILEKCSSDKKFSIVGHSYGALIGIEIARKLEGRGFSGRLTLIDGAPEYLRVYQNHHLGNADQDLQDRILLYFGNILAPEKMPEILQALKNSKTWENKVNAALDIYPKTKDDLPLKTRQDLCTSFYKRNLALLNYDISKLPKIKSSVKLFRPTSTPIKMDKEDYGLSEVTSGTVEVYHAEGDHLSMLKDERIAKTINEAGNS